METIFTAPCDRREKRGSSRAKVAACNSTWGRRDGNPGSPTPEPALHRLSEEPSSCPPPPAPCPSKSGAWHIPPGAGLSGPSAGRTKQSLSLGKTQGRRPRLGLRGRGPHSFALTVSPEPSGWRWKCPGGPREPRKALPGRMTLDPPPGFGPQFPHPGLAPGASRSSRPLEPQASHTPPFSRPPFRSTYAGRRPLQGRPPSPRASVASLPSPPAARVLHRRRRGTCGRQARQPQRRRFTRSYRRR